MLSLVNGLRETEFKMLITNLHILFPWNLGDTGNKTHVFWEHKSPHDDTQGSDMALCKNKTKQNKQQTKKICVN